MKNYRLKKEAVQFFQEKYATSIQPFDVWKNAGVDEKALEEVEDAYLAYGHQDRNNKSSSLGGWDKDNGQYFHFTVNFPSVKWLEHDKFSNGKVIRELMNRIQQNINYFYQDFVNKELE